MIKLGVSGVNGKNERKLWAAPRTKMVMVEFGSLGRDENKQYEENIEVRQLEKADKQRGSQIQMKIKQKRKDAKSFGLSKQRFTMN